MREAQGCLSGADLAAATDEFSHTRRAGTEWPVAPPYEGESIHVARWPLAIALVSPSAAVAPKNSPPCREKYLDGAARRCHVSFTRSTE